LSNDRVQLLSAPEREQWMLPEMPNTGRELGMGKKLGTSAKPQLLRAKRGTTSESQLEQDPALPALAADRVEWK